MRALQGQEITGLKALVFKIVADRSMTDIVPQVLLVTSWISNWKERRRQKNLDKQIMKDYDSFASLLYFRPVTLEDLPVIDAIEVSDLPERMRCSCYAD